jgi:hypothetical protein
MVCDECEVEAEGTAVGWLAFRAEGEGDQQPVLTFYRPRCSYFEFSEYLRSRSTRADDKRSHRHDE